MQRVAWQDAERWVRDALRSGGYSEEHSEATAWGLIEAEAGGISTHGMVRTLHYLEVLDQGEVTPDARPEPLPTRGDGDALLLDARGGYGFLPMRQLTDQLCDQARDRGVALGGVRNSHHYGAGWLYAARAARQGLAAIVMTSASANLAGPGARRAVVGNNPLSMAVPGPDGHGPVCGDLAMSVVAQGKIRLAQRLGTAIPEGWARDADGGATTDPDAAVAAGLLEPIGGHKGFVLAAMIEIMAGIVTGSPFGVDSAAHRHATGGVGHFAVVFDPTAFVDPAQLRAHIGELADQISAAADGDEQATLPGWPEEARRRDAAANGLPLDEQILTRLSVLDEKVGWSLASRTLAEL